MKLSFGDKNKCDICGSMAFNSMSEKCKNKFVDALCWKYSSDLWSFDSKLIKINQNRYQKTGIESMVSKNELIIAKAICLKAGLIMEAREPILKKQIYSNLFLGIKQ